MFKRIIILIAIVALLLCFLPVSSAQAVRGTPGSSEFGFGALVDLNSQAVEDGIQLASNLQLDWVKVEISWSALQSTRGGKINWSSCDQAFQSLSHYKLNSLVSITLPPAWSITDKGPDSQMALKFIQQLLQKYGSTIAAIELFPAANTRAGWGSDPNPGSYMAVWKIVRQGLAAAKSPVLLVAGGLVPGKTDKANGQVNDLDFLQGMYSAGARDLVQVVSLQLLNPVNAPEAAPDPSAPTVLRHYEEIRQVMLQNDHEKGMLWISGMGIPQALDDFGTAAASLDQKQADWLAQAFNQLRSQLYIGVAFLDSINPDSTRPGSISLITPSGDLHPAFRVLRDQIAQNAAGASYPRPGRAKSETLVKGK